MVETDIEQFYSRPDKFGELQYLNRNSKDTTEISYDSKLQNYLDSVLINEDLSVYFTDKTSGYLTYISEGNPDYFDYISFSANTNITDLSFNTLEFSGDTYASLLSCTLPMYCLRGKSS